MAWRNPEKTGDDRRRTLSLLLGGLGILAGAVYLGNFKLPALIPLFSHSSEIKLYLILFLILSVIYLGAVVLVLKNQATIGHSPAVLGLVVLFAVFFRICLVPADPTVLSQDMYRYIWDGRVQQSGINPYRYPPAAAELDHLRDEGIFPKINRKPAPTIYPAAAQAFFRLFYLLAGDNVAGFKGLLVLFDTMTMLALIGLLTTHGFAPARIIIYAWNPLVIFEIAYSGHLEGLAVFFLVTAFYLQGLGRKNGGVALLAVAGAIKLYPALLLAALLNKGRRIKGLMLFGASLALLYLPYLGVGREIFGFLPTYLNNPDESFNLGLKSLLLFLWPGLDYARLSQVFLIFLLLAAMFILTREKGKVEVLRSAFWLTGLLLLFMPASLHPWYVIMIVPFLAFFPSPAWLFFSGAVSLSYLKYITPGEIMPTWVLLTEYLPLFALLSAAFFLKNNALGNLIPALFPGRTHKELTEVEK
jgi:alpha-1,6-mannosyltransferase